jgi:hypothetical protein
LTAAGFATRDQVERGVAALRDPHVSPTLPMLVSAWGRKPQSSAVSDSAAARGPRAALALADWRPMARQHHAADEIRQLVDVAADDELTALRSHRRSRAHSVPQRDQRGARGERFDDRPCAEEVARRQGRIADDDVPRPARIAERVRERTARLDAFPERAVSGTAQRGDDAARIVLRAEDEDARLCPRSAGAWRNRLALMAARIARVAQLCRLAAHA